MDKEKIKEIKNKAEIEIDGCKDRETLNKIFKKYLSKKGEIVKILKSLPLLAKDKRAEIGKEANLAKNFLSQKIKEKKEFLEKSFEIKKVKKIDITLPAKKIKLGRLHPLTLTIRKIEEIFQEMGFSVVSGPEIENEWYNFDALNIPKNHPARDVWDTFYLKNGFLLRTHTSPVQIRFMEKNNPPFRIIAPGRVYRHEATDASHEFDLFQTEGLMAGKDVSVANFKAIIQEFLSRFFNKKVDIRLRTSFFPFVEPGFEVDMSCLICLNKGCSVCSKTGWLELMGAGMVHPNVLKAGGINPNNWQGFAFGVGVERLAMLKYRINDIRLFRSGDLRFLNQF